MSRITGQKDLVRSEERIQVSRKVALRLTLASLLVLAFGAIAFASPTNRISNELDAKHTVFQESVHSTYQFSYEIPSEIAMGEQRTFDVTLSYLDMGDIGYDFARVNVNIVEQPAPSSVELWATDDTGTYNLAEVGYWGPEGGFPIGKDYVATTSVEVVFHNTGQYSIELTLIDRADDDLVLVTSTITVDVVYPLTLSWNEDAFGSTSVGETITVNTTATRNTENPIERMYYVIEVYKDDDFATSDDVEAIGFGQDSEGKPLPSEGIPVAYSGTPGIFYFGDPGSGFTFTAEEVSTSFEITFNTPGEYQIKVWANQLPLD